MLVLIQAAVHCEHCEGKHAYTVSVGAVSGFITLVYLLMARYNRLPSNARFVLAVFMFIWWTIGAGMLTFPGGMFQVTGNGYFGSWGAWCCSAWLMKTEYGRLQSLVDRFSEQGHVSWLLLASLLETCAAIAQCTEGDHIPGFHKCQDYDAFALATGMISLPKVADVSVVMDYETGEATPLPQHITSVVISNIRSYASGTDIWGGKPSAETRHSEPRIDDRLLELTGVISPVHMGFIRGNVADSLRLGQLRSVDIRYLVPKSISVQVDGEPFQIRGPARILVTHKEQVPVLVNLPVGTLYSLG